MRIKSKSEFFKLWEAGVLGNRTRLFRSLAEALASGASEIGFRELGKSGGGAWTKVPRSDVQRTFENWEFFGRKFIMDDGAPLCYTLQGEVCRTYRGLEGFLGVSNLPMRRAIAAGHFKNYGGASVLVLLDRYMDPSSRDDLNDLLEIYPDATVEFSCFETNVGVFPNRCVIFWEVRNY